MNNISQIKSVLYEAFAGTKAWAINHIVVYPLLELMSLGFFTKYLLKLGTDIKVVTFLAIVPIIAQGIQVLNLRFVINFQHHLWSGTGIHLSSSPIKKINWLIGCAIYAVIMMMATVTVMGLYYKMFVSYSLGVIISWLPLIIFPMIMTGFALGLFSLSMVLIFGHKGGEVVWMSPVILGILSGLQYPITVLPNWLAVIAKFSPMQPLFEGIRRVVYGQEHIYSTLIRANISGLIWLVLMLIFVTYALKNFYQKGKVSIFVR